MIQTMGEKTMPNNSEAEQSVLGALLLDSQALYAIAGVVKPDDFYYEKNRWVFETITDIDQRGDAVDFLSVSAELERRGRLNDVGGCSYLTVLINATPTAMHADTHARIVADLGGKRRIIRATCAIAEQAYDGTGFTDTLSFAQKELLKLMPRSRMGASDIDTLVANQVYEYNLRDSDPRDVAGVATGFAALDDNTKGLDTGLHVWQAESSHGKTALALNVMAQAARKNQTRSGMFTLEMTPEQLVNRLISMECGINTTILATGKMNGLPLTPDIITRRRDAAQRVASYGSQIEYCGGQGVADIRSRIIYHKLENGIDIAFVDFVQLIRGSGQSTRALELDAICGTLNETANELGIPIVATSQVSRDKMQRGQIPGMDRARDSGGIEQNAGCLASIVYEDRNHLFEASYNCDRVVTFNGLKDRLHGLCIDKIVGFRIDADTSRLTELMPTDLIATLRARKVAQGGR